MPVPFPLPHFGFNLQTLQALMALEHRAPEVVTKKVTSFISPGDKLVGPSGRPDPSVAMRMNAQVTDYLHELLATPTLVEEWASSNKGVNASCLLGGSFQVTFLVESEVARILVTAGREKLVNLSVYLVIEALRAFKMGTLVKDNYREVFKAEQKGVTVINGVPEEFLMVLAQLVTRYLTTRGLVKDGATTQEGDRLLQHLVAVTGYLMSRETQAPQLARDAMDLMKKGETKTTEMVRDDLQAPQGEKS